MSIAITNNAYSFLDADITATATSFVVEDVSSFPTLGAGEYFYCTLESTGGSIEIVKVNSITGTTFSVTRGQEDTAAIAFSEGARVELRVTAATLADVIEAGLANTGFDDIYLDSGATINWDSGDVVITHSPNSLAFSGATSGYTFTDSQDTFSSLIVSNTNVGTSAAALLGVTADSGSASFIQWSNASALSGLTQILTPSTLLFTVGATNALRVAATAIQFQVDAVPRTTDTAALGTTALMWSDLFLASGAVINFNAGDVTITHSANTLAFAGASSDYTFDNTIKPATDDGAQLGGTNYKWSDLFLASGAVINFNNGDVTITHSANTLAFAGAASGYTFTDSQNATSGVTVSNTNAGASAAAALTLTADSGSASLIQWSTASALAGLTQLITSDTLLFTVGVTSAFRISSTAVQSHLNLTPRTNDGAALGVSGTAWSDLFLASGAVINFNSGDVTITHSANTLAFAGASTGYTFDAPVTLGSSSVLSTPASGTLTNCTGLPISSGVSGLAANVATFLATPSSANLRTALTDKTGSGLTVFATGPTVTTLVVSSGGIDANGNNVFSRASNVPIVADRTTNDGSVIDIRQDGSTEGSISVSGTTVSYGAFMGSHWAQFANFATPDGLLDGTIMETIDELCEWIWDEWYAPVEKEDGTSRYERMRSFYFGTLEPNDSYIDEMGFTHTIIREKNDRLARVKVSDNAGSSAVYGVYFSQDFQDGAPDYCIASLGAGRVRIANGQNPQCGDLIESNGDGCGRVQADNILRASTVAKITSATPVATYPDGSFVLPCTLHCG